MKNLLKNPRWLVAACLLAVGGGWAAPAARAQQYVPPTSNRVDLNFNPDWRFIKTDVPGAQAPGFDDSAWSPVSLPHTWNDDKYREWVGNNGTSDPAKGGSTPADPLRPNGTYYGIGWYRKHFTVDAAYAGRKVLLEFQGIGRCAHFYVNGQDLGYHENGIGPCGLDVTAALNPAGTDNVIAVWVTNDFNYVTHEYGTPLPYGQPFNLNFGGLHRDVTLHICDPLYQTLPLYRNLGTQGVYAYASNIDTLKQTGTLTVQAEVKNEYAAAKTATLDTVVVDAAGNQVGATLSAPAQAVPADGAALPVFTATANLTGLHLWSPDYPYLYQIYTVLKVNGAVVDVVRTPFGFRKFKFGSTIGLQINGHSLYLNGYAPRSTMEWPTVGIPPDWMVDFDFALLKASSGNFLRPMHSAPRKVQVDAADKFGVVLAVPPTATENDEPVQANWVQKVADMRDVVIYFRNHPSVYFWEGCNGDLSASHMQDMLNVTAQWDAGNVQVGTQPNGKAADPNNAGRVTGTRAAGTGSASYGLRQYSSPIESNVTDATVPIWDAEYARGECPRHVWDNYTPMLNPRWDGVNPDPTPAQGTVGDTTHKYLIGGYFYLANDYYQKTLGLNMDAGAGINDYLAVIPGANGQNSNGYYRLMNSEELMLENTAKFYGRYEKSALVQPAATSAANGVTVGGAKIIWADSVTDGRMASMEVARVSGAVDGARLPKETFYGMRVAQNSVPDIYIAGHWNYPAGTVKTVYVVSNSTEVKLKTFDPSGNLLKDYGFGTTNFFPAGILSPASDQVNSYVFAFPNVAWQPGSIQAIGYNDGSTAPVVQTSLGDPVHPSLQTVGAPTAIKITPVTGPAGWTADGSDIAMFDVEVVDAAGRRCPTYEDTLTFSCTGPGAFLGGYNTGVRYSTNVSQLTSGYKLNIESGVNRVFVRATRTAGTFTLNATGAGLTAGQRAITSNAFPVSNGVTAAAPQQYTVALGTEPKPVAEGTAPPPPPNSPAPAPASNVAGLHYSGAHTDQAVLIENVQPGQQAYVDSAGITLPSNLPGYLIGGEFVQPFLSDATSQSGTDQYQMNITRYSYVYQLIDAANGMPSHDNNGIYGWTKLADTVTVNSRPMSVYRSVLLAPYSSVYLAVNGFQNAAPGYTPGSNMYLLFVVSAEQEVQIPSDAIAASTVQNASTPASAAIDGNVNTRWNASTGALPQTLTLTLNNPASIGGYDVNWQNNASHVYQYQIDVSPDGTTWYRSLDQTANANSGEAEFRVPAPLSANSTNVKYIRLTVTNASGGAYAAVNEWRVRGVFAPAAAATVPVITSPLTASGQGAYAFSYQIAAGNGPTGYAAQGLPAGLTLNGVSGLISGTTLQGGTFPVTISGINAGGSGSAVLQLTMAPPPPVPVISNPSLSYSTPAGAAIANPYIVTATNLNYTPASLSATLPANLGLAFSNSTGRITGTPKFPGAFTIPLSGTNVSGTGPVANLAFTVTPSGPAPALTGAGSAGGTVGTAFSYQIAATNSPTLYAATNLPPGLTLNTGTGLISGTPTAAGTYNAIALTAYNAGGQASANLTITVAVNPNAPAIKSALTASGNIGVAFSYQIAATNSPTGYTAAPLPAGLTLGATGLISGTPTTQATTSVVLKAVNASGSDTKTLVVTVGPALTPPVLNCPVNAVGAVNVPFSYQITATNAPTAFTAAPLPAGLSVNPNTGLISGTPTAAAQGTTAVSLGASNAGGASAARTLSVVISPAGSDINLALNQPTFTLDPPINNNVGGYAVDGSPGPGGTRWESPHTDTEWIYVDLGASCAIHAVNLDWETACGQNYTIEVSSDKLTWTNFVTPVTGNKTSGWLYYPGTATGQYVRMNGTLRATGYGYSLFEFQVMGKVTGPAAPGGLAAGAGGGAGQIALSWNAVPNAQTYTLQRGASATGSFVTVGTVTAPAVTYTDSDPALQAGQNYYYRIAATTAQGTSGYSAPVFGTPTVPPGLAGWRYQHFGSAGLSPTLANGAADGADPAHDGLPNLLKYALGLDPAADAYAGGAGTLPTVQRQTVGGTDYLTLTFTGAASDVTYNVQGASDLTGVWTTVATYSGSAGVGTITARDTQPVSASAKRFLRLQVTAP